MIDGLLSAVKPVDVEIIYIPFFAGVIQRVYPLNISGFTRMEGGLMNNPGYKYILGLAISNPHRFFI